MANRIQFDIKAFDEFMKRFDYVTNKEYDLAINVALQSTVDYLNPRLFDAIALQNLPAHGKYSKGGLKQNVLRNQKPISNGVVGEIDFGFNKQRVPYSDYLITGTPKMARDEKLYKLFYGKKTKDDLKKVQENAVIEAIYNGLFNE